MLTTRFSRKSRDPSPEFTLPERTADALSWMRVVHLGRSTCHAIIGPLPPPKPHTPNGFKPEATILFTLVLPYTTEKQHDGPVA